MGLIERITEARERLVLRHAEAHTPEGEDVIKWARTKVPHGRKDGFVYLTNTHFIVFWEGDGTEAIPFREFDSWGMKEQPRGGPVLDLTRRGESFSIQFPVHSRRRARDVSLFLEAFIDLAPWPSHRVGLDEVDPEGSEQRLVSVKHERRSKAHIAQRAVVTTVGVSMIIVGILLIPVPGPWSFIINIGGLAVLASEYDLAKDLLLWSKEKFDHVKAKVAKRRKSRSNA